MKVLASVLWQLTKSNRVATGIFIRALSSTLPSDGDGQPIPSKPFSEMPELRGWPVVGIFPVFIRIMKSAEAGDFTPILKIYSELGPIFKLKIFRNIWLVNTISPQVAEIAFRAEGKYPSRGIFEDNLMWIYKKIGSPPPMFFSGGEIWKKIRSNASKQVIPRRVGNFVEPLSDIADEFLAHLESIKDKFGNVDDIRPELSKWSFQGVSYFVYGEKINIYSGADPLQEEFIKAALEYIDSLVKIASAPPLYKWFPTKTYRNFVRIVKRMQEVGKKIVDRRYKEIKDAISSGYVDETKPVGLLDQWLIEGKFTEEEALSQSYDMLSAGIDTTASSASFLLYEIAKYPELQERLVQEISSVVGDKKHPSLDDLQKMSLLRNCVKETLRMYVPVAGMTRTLAEDTVLMGYQVPAGVSVGYNVAISCKDASIFEEPTKFKPDRWNKDALEKIHPFSFIPFGFGPRSCYGRRLAELEMHVLLSKTLMKYQMTTDVKDIKVTQKVILKPDTPLQIKFHPRT